MAFLRGRSRLSTQAVAADQEREELPVSQADQTCPQPQGETLGYAQFKVAGEPSSQFLMRIFGLFAQQDLLPRKAAVCNLDGVLIVRMTTALIARHRAGVIAEKMRSLVQTHEVQVSWNSPRGKVKFNSDRPPASDPPDDRSIFYRAQIDSTPCRCD